MNLKDVTSDEVEKSIVREFTGIAKGIGYSEVHGSIISALIMHKRPLSLQELAEITGYSISMISISLDLLEMVGLIQKSRKSGDRRIYAQIKGDMLEGLRTVVLLKLEQSLNILQSKLEGYENELKNNGKNSDKVLKGLDNLKTEVKRVKVYMRALSDVPVPKI